jgi:hypothetical protein
MSGPSHGAMPAAGLSGGGWQAGILGGSAAAADRSAHGREFPAESAVIKLGGSLLRLPDWPRRARSLLDAVGGGPTIVVGGGAVVDGLRAIDAAAADRSAALDAVVHRLAIEAMGITARLVAHALGLPLVETVPAVAGRQAVVLDVPAWLSHDDRLAALPAGWHVTSDSIAAVVAAACGRGLLLAKSVPPPPCPDPVLASLSAAGWVDGFFPTAARHLRVIGWAAPAEAS